MTRRAIRGKGDMAKRQPDKETHYKKIINKQKSIIQDLKKKAGRGEKAKERFDDLELELIAQIEEEKEVVFERQDVTKCPECGKGTLETIDLKIRKMYRCDNCAYRVVKKS